MSADVGRWWGFTFTPELEMKLAVHVVRCLGQVDGLSVEEMDALGTALADVARLNIIRDYLALDVERGEQPAERLAEVELALAAARERLASL